MIAQAQDFLAETRELDRLFDRFEPEDWERPTRFKGWTAEDVLQHLHFWNRAAGLALTEPRALLGELGRVQAVMKAGGSLREAERPRLDELFGPLAGEALRQAWRALGEETAAVYAEADPGQRVPWAGPPMSARSAIVARQMETWAHGQALYDLFGVDRDGADRLRNIAELGIRTFGWTFANRGEPVPASPPAVRLVGPSGALWVWNEDAPADERISGSAFEFCQVVTQVRHVEDTGLDVTGEVARRWMANAQCFAGPPVDPPAPGTRIRADAAR